jgi:phospholipase/carboxylesterase
MTPADAPVLDAIAELLSPLLGALERIGWVQRHLYPPLAGRLAETLAPHADALEAPLAALPGLACPDDLAFMRDRLAAVARETVELVRAFTEAAGSREDVIGLYRALRRGARIQEALYPLAPALAPVSRWFLEPARRGDEALIASLRDAACATMA